MRSASPFVKVSCLAFLMTALTGVAFAGEVAETIERSFSVSGRPSIYVRNGDGQTRITADSQSQVRVKAIKEVRHVSSHDEALRVAERVRVRIEQSGNRIEVAAEYPRNMGGFFGNEPQVLVHFEISAPKASDIDAKSGDGQLDVYQFDGRIDLETGDGDLTADNCSGRISARTGDGGLRVEGARGEVSARSGDGRMTIDGVLESLDAKSGDGRMDVTARAGSKMRGEWSLQSGDGGISLRLPEGFAAELDVRTSDGRIECEQEVRLEGSSSQNRLAGKLNNGGYRLRIQSGDGNISIRKS